MLNDSQRARWESVFRSDYHFASFEQMVAQILGGREGGLSDQL